MKDTDRNYDFDKITKQDKPLLVVLLVVSLGLALWAFNAIGLSEGNSDFAFVSLLAMGMSAWYFRDLWPDAWFWLVFVSLCILHAAFVWFVPLPQIMGHGSGGGAGVGVCLFDMFFTYCCVRLAERASQGWPKTTEIACRVCGKDIKKTAVKCPYCGAWHPAPPSQWVILIGLAPIFVFGVIIWILVQTKVLHS
jgi:hypothetical protein